MRVDVEAEVSANIRNLGDLMKGGDIRNLGDLMRGVQSENLILRSVTKLSVHTNRFFTFTPVLYSHWCHGGFYIMTFT